LHTPPVFVFSVQELADEYYQLFNNTAFNSIECDICHLVYVGQVEMLKESEVRHYSANCI